ncbi:DUF3703 domain-containing protein [Noviherbaspirillum massiliense]|uniref:DUF3703 domain-containing protein n=1 Tax=Noviherbaspirillum massiliense TaxID=1465823 RepID=UPI0003196CAB|nr:DUF3703 domain-containing protein [Noviherbaspirillum massiliense]
MSTFGKRIRPHVTAEISRADRAEREGYAGRAFLHLERAHVLGQASTREHVRVHWRMLVWGWRRRDMREVAGQLLRLVGAATKTAIGFIPSGNTGGANISPVKRLPVPADLVAIIQAAKQR